MRQKIAIVALLLGFGLGQLYAQDSKNGPAPKSFFTSPTEQVDFWGTGKRIVRSDAKPDHSPAAKFSEVLVGDDGRLSVYTPPRVVLNLLESPTQENARAYLAWQRERLQAISRALEAIQSVSEAESKASTEDPRLKTIKLVYYKLKGCPACDAQDGHIAKLEDKLHAVTVIEDAGAARIAGVDSFPTLILVNRVTGQSKRVSGVTSDSDILRVASKLQGDTNAGSN